MGGLERLYLTSPVPVQHALVAGYGWWWHRRRFSAHFHRLVADFQRREHWTRSQFLADQETRLERLLSVSWRSPHYRRVFLEAGITASTPPFDALARLPFLSKEELRTSPRQLLTTSPFPRGTKTFKSSGTTGTPTEIYYTPEFHALEVAVAESRTVKWAGASYTDRRVMFGARKVCRFTQSRPPFWRFSPVENMAYASVYHLAPDFLPAYVEFLRGYKPRIIAGYPSALYAIAQYALAHDDLPAKAHAICTTSEKVPDYMRATIEAAWQAKVFDRYGAVEGCMFASQCEYGRYHVSPEIGIVEIVDSRGRAVEPGVEGEVVCTGLQNVLQPLIRYRIGDWARWAADQTCPCGRQLPILDGIEGRVEDVCYTTDGRQILRFDTVFKGILNIREAQIVQEELDHFTVNVVPTTEFGAHDIENIKKNMRLHIGGAAVHVACVTHIPRTQSGKFRAVQCQLSADQKSHYRSAATGS
jgi:phenylacetate-CoA ligase